MNMLLLIAVFSAQFIRAQKFVDGVRKKAGSYECPSGYHSVQDIATCKQIGLGPCLSNRDAECRIWGRPANSKASIGHNHGVNNQPGCYYDTGNGVLFNTNNKWSGNLNEKDDRPICELNTFAPPSGYYSDGIKQPGGSRLCPSGYAPINSEKECRQVAEGRCLSADETECRLWSKWVNAAMFAKDHKTDNQPGCYYDTNDGVLFNTNTAWSGKFNERDERPICKYHPSKFGYVSHGTCEDVGMHSIFSDEQCKAAAADLSITDPYGIFSFKYGRAKWTYTHRPGDHGSDRPTGCSFKNIKETNNVELWGTSSGKCDANGSEGCFCSKDGFYVDGVRKPSGSNSCPIYYVRIDDVEECKKVAEGPCLSNRTEECKVWSKWINSDGFAKDHGAGNQPGCYYDQNDGVLFNSNTAWNGKFNEDNDRPVCKKDPETFSESGIVRSLRQLIVDVLQEIDLIRNDVSESEKIFSAAQDDLRTARVEEGRVKDMLNEAKSSERQALGRLEVSKKEFLEGTPDLNKEIELFKTILTKLNTLLSNATEQAEKNQVQLDAPSIALISSMQQADPVQIKKVSDMINALIQDANSQLQTLKNRFISNQVSYQKATKASSKAYGFWAVANSNLQSELARVNNVGATLSERRQHADVRIPELQGENSSIEEAIVLIKSLEE